MIGRKIPENVWKVGVFVNESPETIAKTVIEADLDVAQLHGSSKARGVRIWRAMSPADPVALALFGDVEAVLIDSPADTVAGGSGRTWDWSQAPHLEQKIVIAGGLDAGNVRLAIQQAHPWGVDACSRIEKSPGIKDHDKMRRFVKAALES